MTKEQELLPQLVNVGIEIDKDDVAAILLARAETMIKNNITACATADKKFKAVSEENYKTLNDELQKACEAAAKKTISLLEEAASELGCKNVESVVRCSGSDSVKNVLHYSLQVCGNKPNINWSVAGETKATSEVKAAWKATNETGKAIQANNTTWLDWRRKLQDLPSMERRARAAVAESRLSRSTEGQDLLAALEGKLDDSIKLLGIG